MAGTLIWALRPSSNAPSRAPAQFSLTLPDDEQVAGLDFPAIALSPLDTHLVYVGNRGGRSQLFVRAMDSTTAQPLAGTDGALGPFFSPDGQWIAFFAAGALKKVPVGGGAVRTITTEAPIGFGGAWAPDNTIVFAPSNASELWRVPADGGKPEAITALDPDRGEFSHRWPEILPDGRSVLFAVGTEDSWDNAVIAVQTIGAKDRRTVVQGGTSPRFSSSGHLLYTRGGVLHSRPFDGRMQESSGQPVPKLARIVESSDGAGQFTISRAGSLAYVPASSGQNDRTLVWVGRDGFQQPLAAPPNAFSDPRLSPDGRMIAMTVVGASSNVFTYEIAGNRLSQFTFEGGSSPIWSADGQRIVFAANRGGSRDLFSKPSDRNGVEERLTRTPRAEVPGAWTTDKGIIFAESDADGRDIAWLLPDRSVRPVLSTPAHEGAPAALARRPRPRICLRPVRARGGVRCAADRSHSRHASLDGRGIRTSLAEGRNRAVLPLGHADAGRRCPHAAVDHPAGRATFVQRTIRDRRGLAAWVRCQSGRNAIPDGPRGGATRAGTRAPDLSRLET